LAQNKGVLRAHVFWLCLLFAVSDAILVSAGVLGFGALVAQFPNLPVIMAWLGAAFLLVYGAMRLWAAYLGDYTIEIATENASLWPTLAIGAALTWLNPHVYLDTVGLIGAVSTSFLGGDKLAFGIGAGAASFVFFFGLGYGARLLAPYMQSARSWRVLDVGIGLVMWAIAIKLIS